MKSTDRLFALLGAMFSAISPTNLRTFPGWELSDRTVPFSSTRQDSRTAANYEMRTVNGFELMQRRPSKKAALRNSTT